MREVAKRVALAVLGGAVTAFLFFMADAAMPEEIQWWMRWVLAGVSFVSYGVGGAMGAWQAHRLCKADADRLRADLDREKKRNAELAARWDEREAERVEAETVDMLASLPVRILGKVRQAYEEGEYRGNIHDPDVQYMLQLEIVGSPRLVSQLGDTPFVMRSKMRRLIDRHRDEVFAGLRGEAVPDDVKARMFALLKPADRRALACLLHSEDEARGEFSVSAGQWQAAWRTLIGLGIVDYMGSKTFDGSERDVYATSLAWRGWLSENRAWTSEFRVTPG